MFRRPLQWGRPLQTALVLSVTTTTASAPTAAEATFAPAAPAATQVTFIATTSPTKTTLTTATTATATKATSATAASIIAGLLLGSGLIDNQIPSLQILAIQAINGSLTGFLGRHFNKSKTLGPPAEFIHDDGYRVNLAEFAKDLP
jgi:hypothetical protein